MALYTTHDTALTVLYGDIERQAFDQPEAFVGFRYYAHKANDAESRARERAGCSSGRTRTARC